MVYAAVHSKAVILLLFIRCLILLSVCLGFVLGLILWCGTWRPFQFSNHMGHVARKPVFGVSDKVSFKPVSSATETSWKTEILAVESLV